MEDNIEMEHDPATLRRTLTTRSNTARQVAVNFMPSRQLSHNTMRTRRSPSAHNALLEEVADAPDGADKQADIIVREMEQHRRLMDDDLAAEEMRREALRDLPQGLTMKRNVRAKLSASVSLRSKRKPISMWRRMKYRISFAWKRSKDRFRDFAFSIELWYEAIRGIEGQFGSAVGSYFYLLRWLFVLDLVLAVFVMAFVVAPQALHDEGRNATEGRWGFLYFLSGKGSYEDSVLFYGHYHHGAISPRGPRYNMPFAYFFTMVCLYLAAFAVLCYRTSYSYRRNFIESESGLHLVSGRVFCGWDCGVASANAANMLSHTLYIEFKELLSEQNKNQITTTRWTKTLHCTTNFLVTSLVLALIAGLQYGFWKLLVLETMTSHWEILVSLTITAVLAVCPLIFSVAVRLEHYSPRTALYVTLCRTWLLDMSTLSLLMYYWAQSKKLCWETSFGQEAYRLVILDCVVSLFLLPLVEFVRGTLYKMYNTGPTPEFNLAYNSLTLVYNQALMWAGALLSPILAAAVPLKLLLLFYVKRHAALAACQPARKIWRAAQTQTILYVLVTLSLFTTLCLYGSLFFRASSQHCGPFREYARVYHVLTEGVLHLSSHPVLHTVLNFVTRPGVIAFVGLFLGVAVYYMRARALAQRSMVALLRQMLVLQAKDKEFLLTAISKVSNGEWLYSPRAEREPADSHTWRYLREVRKPSNSEFHFDASRLSHSLIEGRPRSFAKDNRASFAERAKKDEDGDTDSSFSWQGSSNYLNQRGAEEGDKKWV